MLCSNMSNYPKRRNNSPKRRNIKTNNKVRIYLLNWRGDRTKKTVNRNNVGRVTTGYSKINGFRINGHNAYRQKIYYS